MKRRLGLALVGVTLAALGMQPALTGADGVAETEAVVPRPWPSAARAVIQARKVPVLPVVVDRLLMVPANTNGIPVLGDWNGDGIDEPAIWFENAGRGALRFANGNILASAGSAAGVPVVGDWDGDGLDTVATWDGPVGPETAIVAGDWEGDGIDEVSAVPKPEGVAVVAGDWNADGIDSLAHVRETGALAVSMTFPFDDGVEAITLDVAPGTVGLAGAFDRDIVDDQLRRLRRMAPERLPNRGVEEVPTSLAPDGSELTLHRVWGITVDAGIADSLEALLTAAYLDGVELAGWGWRSHEQQIELRRAHCGPSEYQIWEAPASSCSPPTARPGSSRHEFGRAIDFTENGSILTKSSPGFAWLTEHAKEFGFKNLPSEPWHWSDTGG